MADRAVLADPAGPWVLAIWGFCLLLLGWAIVANPKTGIRVHEEGIDWWSGRRSGTIAKSALEAVTIVDWSDSTNYSIVPRDGEPIQLAALVGVDEAELERSLLAHGMKLIRR